MPDSSSNCTAYSLWAPDQVRLIAQAAGAAFATGVTVGPLHGVGRPLCADPRHRYHRTVADTVGHFDGCRQIRENDLVPCGAPRGFEATRPPSNGTVIARDEIAQILRVMAGRVASGDASFGPFLTGSLSR